MLKQWIAVLIGVGAMSCGSSNSPEDKCDDFIVEVCSRGAECLDATADEEDECLSVGRASLPCGQAASVTASYDDCMDRLSTASCDTLFAVDPDTGEAEITLPQICSGVVVLERTAGAATALPDVAGLRTVMTSRE